MKNTLPKEFIRMQKLAGIITENESENLSAGQSLFKKLILKLASIFPHQAKDFSDEGIKKALKAIAETEYEILKISPLDSDERNLEALDNAKNIDHKTLKQNIFGRNKLQKYADNFEPNELYVNLTKMQKGDTYGLYKDKIKDFLENQPIKNKITIDNYTFTLSGNDLIITK